MRISRNRAAQSRIAREGPAARAWTQPAGRDAGADLAGALPALGSRTIRHPEPFRTEPAGDPR
ncbi:hypothetical protein GCM10023086_69270 [Streptomyces venetus]|uniref:Uncharacterized protein n=1 Tax=Streptomyces venetus TaxID=1701086 RepID=A0ABP8H9W0_9ACTN